MPAPWLCPLLLYDPGCSRTGVEASDGTPFCPPPSPVPLSSGASLRCCSQCRRKQSVEQYMDSDEPRLRHCMHWITAGRCGRTRGIKFGREGAEGGLACSACSLAWRWTQQAGVSFSPGKRRLDGVPLRDTLTDSLHAARRALQAREAGRIRQARARCTGPEALHGTWDTSIAHADPTPAAAGRFTRRDPKKSTSASTLPRELRAARLRSAELGTKQEQLPQRSLPQRGSARGGGGPRGRQGRCGSRLGEQSARRAGTASPKARALPRNDIGVRRGMRRPGRFPRSPQRSARLGKENRHRARVSPPSPRQ